MDQVGTEPDDRSGGDLDDALVRCVEARRIGEEASRVARVARGRTAPVRSGS
jgi:hypothetical protein